MAVTRKKATPPSRVVKKSLAKLSDYRAVFESGSGKNVLTDMMTQHHVFGSSSVKGGTSHDTSFRDGERAVVLRILKLLYKDPTELRKRLEEALNANRSEQRESGNDIIF